MNALAVLEDSTILSLLNNKEIVAAIPCFANKSSIFSQSGGGCGACARKRQQRQRTELLKIKTCLAALSPEKQEVLKKKLNAKKIRVVYVNSAGQTTQTDF